MKPDTCQISRLQQVADGTLPIERLSLQRRVKLMFHRYLSPGVKRIIKKQSNQALISVKAMMGRATPLPVTSPVPLAFQAGDLVRIRSQEDIQVTLSMWGELKGCGVMKEMWEYCGTVQRVLKPVERFLDERDYRLRKVKGIYLLDGVMCQGTAMFGRCDRSCYFFWRQEWLEKVDVIDESRKTEH